MALDPRRVVFVWAGRATGRSGSGYLLTPRLVLTARHVVVPSAAVRCTVRPLPFAGTVEEHDSEAIVEWSVEELDVALLRIVDARWSAGAVRDGWWAPVTGTDEVLVSGVGFPRFQRDDTEQLVARLRPLSGLIRHRLELIADDPPTARDDEASPWAGISGAAVFAEDML